MRWFYENAFNVVWFAWVTWWVVAAVGAKATIRRESVASRVLHITPLLLGIALFESPRLAGGWLTMRYLSQTRATFFTGLILTLLGLGFSVLARARLGRNWSGTVTLKQDHELIRAGPYRWVRHPIYTGLLAAVLGSAIALGEWRGLVALALITVSLLRKIQVEERFLTERFGAAYTRYQAEVPALVPGLF